MKQKTRIASKLFAALVVLTLISCCFLGTTMARYTSVGPGTASVQVAKWDISIADIDSAQSDDEIFTAKAGKLSPSKTGFIEWNNSPNNPSKTSSLLLSAVITNNGEVDAKITLSAGSITDFTFNEDNTKFDSSTGYGWDDSEQDLTGTAPTEAQVKDLFSINMHYANNDTVTDAVPYTSTSDIIIAPGASVYVWTTITWTTNYIASQSGGNVEDAIDTWVGQNVKSFKYTISYTAVQASELPA